MTVEFSAQGRQVSLGIPGLLEGVGGDGCFVRPVGVEHLGCLRYHRANGKQVKVPVVVLVAGIEVIVGDVAAADHCHLVVDDEALVVHAPVQPAELQQHLRRLRDRAGLAGIEGIEDPDLDLVVRIERIEHRLGVLVVDVVHQQAHAHAAVGRGQQVLGEQFASGVIGEDEVLQVDADAGLVHQRQPAEQPVRAQGEHAESRFVVDRLADFGNFCDRLGDRRGIGRRDRSTRRLVVVFAQASACASAQQDGQRHGRQAQHSIRRHVASSAIG